MSVTDEAHELPSANGIKKICHIRNFGGIQENANLVNSLLKMHQLQFGATFKYYFRVSWANSLRTG